MAPVTSRKDKTTTKKHPHVVWSYDATSFSPVPPHGVAMRYPSPMELTPNAILQTNTTSTPSYGNQGYQKRRIPELRKINHNPTKFTRDGVASNFESYNRDLQQLQNEVLQIHSPRTQSQLENSSALPDVHNAYYGHSGGRILPNQSSNPLNRTQNEKSSATSRLYHNTSSVTGDPRVLQSHSLYYPKDQLPSTFTHISSPHFATTDRRDISHQNLKHNSGSLDKFAGAQYNAKTASYAGTDQIQKTLNCHPLLAEEFSKSIQMVYEYLNYLRHKGYPVQALHAQKFLTLKYPGCKDLVNPYYCNLLNEWAEIIILNENKTRQKIISETTSGAARASFKPPPPFNNNILPASNAYDTLQHLHYLQRIAEGSVHNGQNVMANIASFSSQNSSNLFNWPQTSQNSTFHTRTRNSQQVMTAPLPTLVEMSPSVGNTNTNQRYPIHGVAKKSTQQKYIHSAMQIPCSAAENISRFNQVYKDYSSVITTAQNQLPHVDVTDEPQNILESQITTMHITTDQPNQPKEHTPIPLNEMIFLQNTSPQKIHTDQNSEVVYETEGLIISYQNSLRAANQKCKAGESLGSINKNDLQLNSCSNYAQIKANTGNDTNNKAILPSTSSSGSKHVPSSSKLYDADNKKVNLNDKEIPPVNKCASEHNSSPNKPQIDLNVGPNCIEKILPSSNKSAIELKSHVESNIGMPFLPSTNHNSSERKSPGDPEVEIHVVKSNEKSHISESVAHTEEKDIQNPLLPENQSLEQEPITEEDFLDEFTSLMNQLDSHNSRTNDLFKGLEEMITKSKETAHSLKNVFSDNQETSDDTVSSTTSTEPA